VDKGTDRRDTLVKMVIYLEGGGDSKELHTRCRWGFRKLLEKCGYKGNMPRLVACGGRGSVFEDFRSAHGSRAPEDEIVMMIDSEDPLTDLEATWDHLKNRDGWEKPLGAVDDQVLFMTTCMETWIITDRDSLISHYGSPLQVSALPPLEEMERRGRHDIQDALVHATTGCKHAYQKGKRSFDILAKLKPDALKPHLPSFRRSLEILDEKLRGIERMAS
jgi:hypothetical protein